MPDRAPRQECACSYLWLEDEIRVRQLAQAPLYNNHATVINGLVSQINEVIKTARNLPLDVILIDSSTDGSEEHVLKALGLQWSENLADRVS